jgi:hypothetical protein
VVRLKSLYGSRLIRTVVLAAALSGAAWSSTARAQNRATLARARVFLLASETWQVSGNRYWLRGGERPQAAELAKSFAQLCPSVTVTLNRDQADYIVEFDHEGGKGYLRRDNKLAVFRKSGDLLAAFSTRTLGGAVRDACRTIERDGASR